jgi:hypothetical protein
MEKDSILEVLEKTEQAVIRIKATLEVLEEDLQKSDLAKMNGNYPPPLPAPSQPASIKPPLAMSEGGKKEVIKFAKNGQWSLEKYDAPHPDMVPYTRRPSQAYGYAPVTEYRNEGKKTGKIGTGPNDYSQNDQYDQEYVPIPKEKTALQQLRERKPKTMTDKLAHGVTTAFLAAPMHPMQLAAQKLANVAGRGIHAAVSGARKIAPNLGRQTNYETSPGTWNRTGMAPKVYPQFPSAQAQPDAPPPPPGAAKAPSRR